MTRIDGYNLLLAALLAILIWLNLRPEQAVAPLAPELVPEQLHSIDIFKEDSLQLSLLRDKDGWLLTHPTVSRANDKRVAQLASLLRAPSRWRADAEPQILQHYGLDKPTMRIRFNRLDMYVGNSYPAKRQRYLLVNDTVHLIDEAYLQIARLPHTHFQVQP